MLADTEVHKRRCLKAGQSWHLHAEAGTVFVAANGSLWIAEASIWLTEHLITRTVIINEGDSFQLQCSGWITLTARDSVEIVRILPDHKSIVMSAICRALALLQPAWLRVFPWNSPVSARSARKARPSKG
jgi:hypothetical protein